METENTVIIIPAYNEEKWLPKTLGLVKDSLRRIRHDAHLIVVDDGSSDETARVASESGCEVIRMPKNVGKANAVYAGLKRAIELGATSTVMLDADILQMQDSFLIQMIDATRKATEEKRSLMVISPWREIKEDIPCVLSSGIRAFSMPAVYKITASEYKGEVRGYGLENFLNDLLKDDTHVINERDAFIGREAHGGPKTRSMQRLEIETTIHNLQKRRNRN